MNQFIAHLIGDYLLQNDWMAATKKKKGTEGLVACLIHCSLYTSVFTMVCDNGYQWLLILITHFLIDRWYFVKWYMNRVGQLNFSKPPFAPWSTIIVDNTFHLVCNFLILKYIK